MDQKQLEQLAKQLNISIEILHKLVRDFNPKDEKELVKVANEVTGLQNELGTQNIDQVIDFYKSNQTQQKTQNDLLEQQKEQTNQRQPIAEQQVVKSNTPISQVTQVAPQAVQQYAQIRPQAASINFEDKFQQGYKFQPRNENDLTGQCAWFAQQITTLPDGSNWTIGNTISEKRNKLQQYTSSGSGFLKGQGQPQVGNSVVLDTGTKYGHVAVISEVLPDGKIRLTESNWDNNQVVRHDRVIDPNDDSVVGFVKTQPTKEFKVEPPKTPPTVPPTNDTKQEEPAEAAGKQEVPIEQQPPKPVANTDLQTPENKNVGFLDVFNKPQPEVVQPQQPQQPLQQQEVINQQKPLQQPEVIKQPEIAKQPVVPQVNKPEFQPQVKPPEPVKPVQTPVLQQPQPQIEQPRQITTPVPNIQPQQSLVQPQQPQNAFTGTLNKVTGFFRR